MLDNREFEKYESEHTIAREKRAEIRIKLSELSKDLNGEILVIIDGLRAMIAERRKLDDEIKSSRIATTAQEKADDAEREEELSRLFKKLMNQVREWEENLEAQKEQRADYHEVRELKIET